MSDARRVLVVGDVIDDVVVLPRGQVVVDADTDAEIRRCPGGSGANTAAWLAALGATVRFAGRTGRGDVARHTAALASAGVDARIAGDEAVGTGTIVVLVGCAGERSMFTDRGANLRLSAADLPASLLADVGLLHVSGYALFEPSARDAVRALTGQARGRGVVVSVDPSSVSFLRRSGRRAFLDWTRGAHLVFPNLAEGRLLSGRDAPDDVVTALLAHYDVVALKLGRAGALVGARAGGRVRVAGGPVDVVDPTGAGDAFCAAFLAAWQQGADLGRCAEAAVRAGARAVGVVGGRPPA